MKVLSPLTKGSHDGEKFTIMDIIVAFNIVEGF